MNAPTPIERSRQAWIEVRREVGLLKDDIRRFQGEIDARGIDPLDSAKRAASKLNRHQRRELMVHLMEIENAK